MLLRVRGIEGERIGWLSRAYFVSYAVGQVLPTSVGGDASRIYETTRRHPGFGSPIAGSVLLERAIGGAVTLVLAALGFLLAIGRYPIGPYLWIEAAFVVATVLAAVVLFSTSLRRHLRRFVPLLRRARVEKPIRAAYEGIHGYRHHVGTLLVVSLVTAAAQLSRIAAIWASSRAVGIDLGGPGPYIVLGPLLFLVMLVPFTINGLGVREAFFVSFLGATRRERRRCLRDRDPLLPDGRSCSRRLGWPCSSGRACGALRQSRSWMSSDVSIVVVTWNSLATIERCLGSVAGHETIVVDNGSSDGTPEFVAARFPEVRLIEQDNRGMGAGNNAGMRAAREPLCPGRSC